jgi:hypothetical protein
MKSRIIMESNYFINMKISLMILIVGVLGDELTTFHGISTGRFVEVNPIARNLIETGIWSLLDILLLSVCFSLSYIIVRKNKNELSQIISLFPIISGIIRLLAFFSNLFLLLFF